MSSEALERLRGIQETAPAAAPRRPEEERPIRPGDVFAFPETAEQAVLWVWISEGRETDSNVAVPADHHPLVGSCDVAVAADSPSGAMTLRCAFEVRLAEQELRSARRIGHLGEKLLEAARKKIEEIREGNPRGSVLQKETDQEWEYRHRLRADLRAACEAVSRRRARADRVYRFRRTASKRIPAGRFALAASVLLSVTLGWIGATAWHRPPTLVGEPFEWLTPLDQRQGNRQTLSVSRGDRYVVLLVTLGPWGEFARKRLTLREEKSGKEVLSRVLERTQRTETVLLVPTSFLVATRYELEVHGLDPPREELLEVYAVDIELDGPPE